MTTFSSPLASTVLLHVCISRIPVQNFLNGLLQPQERAHEALSGVCKDGRNFGYDWHDEEQEMCVKHKAAADLQTASGISRP